MKRQEFTNGPWKCSFNYKGDQVTSLIIKGPQGELIADVFLGGNAAHNAALIEASPIMYQALKDLYNSGRLDDDSVFGFRQAKAALAQANPQ